MGSLDLFSAPTRAWFASTFATPTAAQEQGWAAIAAGGHTLIHAPTGSGKTLAAFLWGVDRLFSDGPPPEERRRCRLLYVSPLKALAYDIERNLRSPLRGIANAAETSGAPVPELTTAMRTGDTPADERRRMLRHPPDVLITTPESLYLMLTSSVREILAPVRWVIVDEIHSVAGSKRGAHLALSLERLEEIAGAPQRIGLSATQRPLEEIGRFLAGGSVAASGWVPRPVALVDVPRDTELDTEIIVPLDDMTRPDLEAEIAGGPGAAPRRSIWPAMYPELLDLVSRHRSTIIFANSRGLVERLAAELNSLAGEEVAKAHHGSVSREQRLEIEDGLKRGTLRCVVATSSLELGIDMEAVDLVVLVESPTSVARGLQRVGRAGHQVGAPSRAKVFPKHRGDLLEATVVVDRMHRGLVEATSIPRNPLDVLAQQIVAMVAMDRWTVDGIFDLVRRAAPYADLGRGPFESVLDMLAGRYPSEEFSQLRARLVWDRAAGTLQARGNARLLAVTNPGTIPDRGLYRVVLPEGGRVGELDEEMVYESRAGDVFMLGTSAWRITEITADRVVVTPAPGEPAVKLPFWKGDTLGRPLETGRALGAFIREIGAMEPERAARTLERDYRLERRAAANLVRYLAEEREATGTLPTDRTIVLQTFRDEIGDWRVVILSPFGARIHAPWALGAARRIRQRHDLEVDAIWSDDGVILRFPDADEPPDPADLLIDPEEIDDLVVNEVGTSALFAARFREAAGRALLLPRRRPGTRTPLWLQRRRAGSLLEAARRHPSFPIVLEAYREVLQEYFDLPALREVLRDVRARRVRPVIVETSSPSPFASSLMFDFIASFMYEYDAAPAERRAMALTVDQGLLRELLGEPELRDLLDPDVIAQVEAEVQHLDPRRRARGPDGVADLLGDLGPLDLEAVQARCEDPALQILESLADAHRVIRIGTGGSARWAAVEDAGRLRDALGIVLPPGIPKVFLEDVADPLGDVVARHARTHGPFTVAEAAAALGLAPAVVATTLYRLEARGRVSRGAFRPQGEGREWVDADVLRRIRRRSLAAARRQIEAVDPEAFARFSLEWHGLDGATRGVARMLEVVRHLQGAAIPASILESDVLDARLADASDLLDRLTASGEVVWIGREPLGARDGRVALYLRDQVASLWWPAPGTPPAGDLHERIRDHLSARGASFFRDFYQAVGGGDPEAVLDALWDLVWAGEVTNDTLAPLRAFGWGRARRRGRAGGPPRLPSAAAPPTGTGRWYLVSELLEPSPSPTASAAARAEQLLHRHGVLVRPAVAAEGLPGGLAGLSPVLEAMEEAGRLRRGYFVDGLGGLQFALPGAIDRLRGTRSTGVALLAAADPASPYGAAIGWPEHPAGRPGRAAGAWVVLTDGALAAFVERGGRRVLTFGLDGDRLEMVAGALEDLARRRMPRMVVATVDAQPARETALGNALIGAGFVTSYRGLALRRA